MKVVLQTTLAPSSKTSFLQLFSLVLKGVYVPSYKVFSHCKPLAFCSIEKYLACLLTLNIIFSVYVIGGVMSLTFIHPLFRFYRRGKFLTIDFIASFFC